MTSREIGGTEPAVSDAWVGNGVFSIEQAPEPSQAGQWGFASPSPRDAGYTASPSPRDTGYAASLPAA